jgi:hypothetical protein
VQAAVGPLQLTSASPNRTLNRTLVIAAEVGRWNVA